MRVFPPTRAAHSRTWGALSDKTRVPAKLPHQRWVLPRLGDTSVIPVINFRTRKVLHKWRIPGGGSPDMGGVSADGRVLWLSGRYSGLVYAIATRTGKLLAKIPVGQGPHGLCVWPQPGRYSLGHTGDLR